MANFVQESADKFCYVYSSELDIPVRIKIGTLEGQRERKNIKAVLENPLLQFSGQYQSEFSDLYVVCQIYANGRAISMPTRTAYKAFSTRWNWNEWIELPLRYKDLPRNSMLALTIYDILGPRKEVAVGGTTISVFGEHGCLRRGFRDLRVWNDVEADCSILNTTPGEVLTGREGSEMTRLGKLVTQHHKGRMMSVDWLDRLTFREIEVINEREKRESNNMYLTIEFPKFHHDGIEHAVVFFEPDGEQLDESVTSSEYTSVRQPDLNQENLVEAMHHKLTLNLGKGLAARDLQPNARTKHRLQTIIHYPPLHPLADDEKSLILQFRYYLSRNKHALPKFLECVHWGPKQEVDEALELLCRWQPLDPADALELLAPRFLKRVDPKVRKYTISRLQCADNEELLLYLLQLVQALRYEEPEFLQGVSPSHAPTLSADGTYSEAMHTQIEAQLYEAAREDSEAESSTGSYEEQVNSDSDTDEEDDRPALTPETPPISNDSSLMLSVDLSSSIMNSSVLDMEFPDLASFLIARACRSTRLASYFYWYLSVECSDNEEAGIKYKAIRRKFVEELKNSSKPKWQKRYSMICQQQNFVEELVKIMDSITITKDDRLKKIDRLRAQLHERKHLLHFSKPMRLPLDPHCQVTGIVSEEASLFKSALVPAKLTFRTIKGENYCVMFKLGDDLRQDQLVLQMIMLIDRLLRRENLDLKLTPYKVLACSSIHGFVQLVPKSDAVAHILAKYKNIQNYFRHHGPSETAPYGISHEVMDTYIKSCAGYSVITYILSVGDRHLDNLLLTEDGNLIHIDFGYMLGRDPKLFPPPMRLSKEMVDAMGGTSSKEFTKFREHCYNAFLTLRRSANLFLSLFSLMLDSGVPDIALEPDKTVQKVKDKFRLDMSEEQAVQYLQTLIDDSIKAVFPELFERIHKLAMDFKK